MQKEQQHVHENHQRNLLEEGSESLNVRDPLLDTIMQGIHHF